MQCHPLCISLADAFSVPSHPSRLCGTALRRSAGAVLNAQATQTLRNRVISCGLRHRTQVSTCAVLNASLRSLSTSSASAAPQKDPHQQTSQQQALGALPKSIIGVQAGGNPEALLKEVKEKQDEKAKELERLKYMKAYLGPSKTPKGINPELFVDPDSAGKFVPAEEQQGDGAQAAVPVAHDPNTLPEVAKQLEPEIHALVAKLRTDSEIAKLDPLTAAAEIQQRVFWELIEKKDEDPEVAWKKAVLASDPFEKLPKPGLLAAYLVVQNDTLVEQRGIGRIGEQFQQHIERLNSIETAVEVAKESAAKLGHDVSGRKSLAKQAAQAISERLKKIREKREESQWGDAGKNFQANIAKRAEQTRMAIIDAEGQTTEAAASHDSSAEQAGSPHGAVRAPGQGGPATTGEPGTKKPFKSPGAAILKAMAVAKQNEQLALQGALGPEAKKHVQAELITRELMGELAKNDPYADWVVRPIDPSRPETGIRTRAEFQKMIYKKKIEVELKAMKKFPSMAKFYPEWTLPTIHELRVELMPKQTLQLESRRRITTEELNTRHAGTFRHMMSHRMFKVFMGMICLLILSSVGLVLWDHHMEFTRGVTPPSWFN